MIWSILFMQYIVVVILNSKKSFLIYFNCILIYLIRVISIEHRFIVALCDEVIQFSNVFWLQAVEAHTHDLVLLLSKFLLFEHWLLGITDYLHVNTLAIHWHCEIVGSSNGFAACAWFHHASSVHSILLFKGADNSIHWALNRLRKVITLVTIGSERIHEVESPLQFAFML